MAITALNLLKAAQSRGWTMQVWGGSGDPASSDPDYNGTSAMAAWRAVKATAVTDKLLGVAYLMAPGLASCNPSETLVNYSTNRGDFTALCDRLIKEAA
jgi:hypothetical protein